MQKPTVLVEIYNQSIVLRSADLPLSDDFHLVKSQTVGNMMIGSRQAIKGERAISAAYPSGKRKLENTVRYGGILSD